MNKEAIEKALKSILTHDGKGKLEKAKALLELLHADRDEVEQILVEISEQ